MAKMFWIGSLVEREIERPDVPIDLLHLAVPVAQTDAQVPDAESQSPEREELVRAMSV